MFSAASRMTNGVRAGAGYSWTLPVLLALFLVAGAGMLTARNAAQEEERLIAGMKDRADVLIWALEGGARSMMSRHMRARPPVPPSLVEEVAKQPDIAYIGILGASGRIVAHSDPSQVGRQTDFLPPALPPEDGDSRGSFRVRDGVRVYDVFKPFTPSFVHRHGERQRRRQAETGRPVSGPMSAPQREESLFIVVGMDTTTFEATLRDYIWNSVALSALGVLALLCGISLVLFRRHYMASRRLLRDTRTLGMQIIHSLPVGLLAVDRQGRVIFINAPGRAMLGLSEETEVPLESLFATAPLDWQGLVHELDTGKNVLEREIEIPQPGRKALPVSLSAARLLDSNGGSPGYFFILRDLGEVRTLQREVQRNERLTALGNLAAGVAHEIRNPLSSIKGYALYLAEKLREDPSAYDIANLMSAEVERLNRVVSDLLGMATPRRLDLAPVVVAGVVGRAARLATPDARAKGIELTVSIAENTATLVIRADADRLVQALLNLLLNGIQATNPGGRVELVMERLPASGPGESELLAVRVRDTGSGMSAATRSSLFTPYFTTKASGTGLGLTITLQIVEQHGGEIKVLSRPGKGSEFTLLLPVPVLEKERTHA